MKELEAHVDRLRLQLDQLNRDEANIQGLRTLVLQEILMTRRQITYPERYST
jgi:hypothetical protein